MCLHFVQNVWCRLPADVFRRPRPWCARYASAADSAAIAGIAAAVASGDGFTFAITALVVFAWDLVVVRPDDIWPRRYVRAAAFAVVAAVTLARLPPETRAAHARATAALFPLRIKSRPNLVPSYAIRAAVALLLCTYASPLPRIRPRAPPLRMDGDEERKEEGEVWSPEGKSQDDFMLKDECIVLDYGDNVIGHDNKYNCHKFTVGMPKGILHRVASGPKLDHELGIAPGVLDPKKFTFTTRVHYFAADLKTHGPDAPWGEHEIDYLLIYKLDYPGSELQLAPHPHEVSATKWVTQEELFREMEAKDSMPLWSPWFEIIAKKFLKTWWEDLDGVVAGERCADYASIHRFDCPDWMGGQGKCEPFLDDLQRRVAASTPEAVEGVLADAFREQMLKDVASTTAVFGASGAEMKQGAYGKVPTHKTSKLKQLLRPFEVTSALKLKFLPSLAG
ncbi:isopentenyl-diphosphate delta-isomerase [Aureococcus anophagefferens]|nr:isopentenyl-diphosphate delta-isomerase [Aureococcus anophagefferens]